VSASRKRREHPQLADHAEVAAAAARADRVAPCRFGNAREISVTLLPVGQPAALPNTRTFLPACTFFGLTCRAGDASAPAGSRPAAATAMTATDVRVMARH
jgi:hypothetical protein